MQYYAPRVTICYENAEPGPESPTLDLSSLLSLLLLPRPLISHPAASTDGLQVTKKSQTLGVHYFPPKPRHPCRGNRQTFKTSSGVAPAMCFSVREAWILGLNRNSKT